MTNFKTLPAILHDEDLKELLSNLETFSLNKAKKDEEKEFDFKFIYNLIHRKTIKVEEAFSKPSSVHITRHVSLP